MDLKLLRDATRPEHEATEAVVPLMHPELSRTQYAAVLQRFHAVIQAWEAVATSEAPAEHAELVRDRSRCAALEADLDYLHMEYSREPESELMQQMNSLLRTSAAVESQRSSEFLGAMYVVEGSTLGGQYIASHVETALQLENGQGSRFFRGYGSATIPKWREFQERLREIPDAESNRTIAAARGMFKVFQDRLSSDFIGPDDLSAREKIDSPNMLRPAPARAS